jgi:hypothetical protein
MEKCFAASDLIGDNKVLGRVGKLVEKRIEARYCQWKGGCQVFLAAIPVGGPTAPPDAQTDFFDRDAGVSPCRHLASYLKLHNPGLDAVLFASQCEMKKNDDKSFPVPDIITHVPGGTGEYYEIKPGSEKGEKEGNDKLAWFDVIKDDYGLPYKAGTKFAPDAKELIWNGLWAGHPLKVYLHYYLKNPV